MTLFRRLKSSTSLTTDRIEAFSDGVFSIAITLLVLGLTVPTLTNQQVLAGDLNRDLLALWPKLLSYIISFAVIGIFWVGHHIMFHYIKRADRNFLWLNILFLMIIAFFPFPASLIGQYSHQKISLVIYGVTLVLAGLSLGWMWLYASTNRRLVDSKLPDQIIRLGRKVVFTAPLVYFIAVLFSFVNITIALVIFIILPILYLLPGPIDELIEIQDSEDHEN